MNDEIYQLLRDGEIGKFNKKRPIARLDLEGANLDFSAWPFWCGSFDVKVDDRLVCQLIYHLLRLDISACSPAAKKVLKMKSLIRLANEFHRIGRDVDKIKGALK